MQITVFKCVSIRPHPVNPDNSKAKLTKPHLPLRPDDLAAVIKAVKNERSFFSAYAEGPWERHYRLGTPHHWPNSMAWVSLDLAACTETDLVLFGETTLNHKTRIVQGTCSDQNGWIYYWDHSACLPRFSKRLYDMGERPPHIWVDNFLPRGSLVLNHRYRKEGFPIR